MSNLKHTLSSKQFDKKSLTELFDLTQKIKSNPELYTKTLEDKIISIMFFEPSTRTRMSFSAAALRLGAKIISTENARENASSTKGESFEDTMRTLSLYSDCIVVRCGDHAQLQNAANSCNIPIINAGSGSSEHPTQALLDLYTIRELKGSLDNLKILITGDLKYGRTVHSLILSFCHFENTTIYALSDDRLALPQEYIDICAKNNIKFCKVDSVEQLPNDIDIVYSTRVQHERLQGNDKGGTYFEFIIDGQSMSHFGPNTYVLHPLPRNNEISAQFDSDNRAKYFEQAQNGMYLRMALLTSRLTKKYLSTAVSL